MKLLHNPFIRTQNFLETKLKQEEQIIISDELFSQYEKEFINQLNTQTEQEKIAQSITFLFELIANIEADYLENEIKKLTIEDLRLCREYQLQTEKRLTIPHFIFNFSETTPFKRIVNFIAKLDQFDFNKIYRDESNNIQYNENLYVISYVANELSKLKGQDIDITKRQLQRYLSGNVIISDDELRLLIRAITKNSISFLWYIAAKLSIKVEWLQNRLKENQVSDEAIKLIFNQYPRIYQSVIKQYPIALELGYTD